MNPMVTVVVDTYNHERFIAEALVSVVEQDFPASEMEILVVDDGSTDRTPEIVRKFEPRVRLLSKSNGGQASAFNFAIPEARGQIVSFLDGDDWWARNKLSRVVETMASDPEVGIVGQGYFEVASQTTTLRRIIPPGTISFSLRTAGGAQTFRNYMSFLGTSRVSIRNSVLQHILPIAEPLVIEADEFMSAAAAAASKALLVPDALTFYRLHDGNLFQLQSADPLRLRRKQEVLAALAEVLSRRLERMGVAPSEISVVVDPIRVSSTRLKLYLDGGRRVDAFRTERADLHHSYERMTSGYYVWKQFSLALALILPPRHYYRARERYSAYGLRRFRSWLGEPQPRARIDASQPSQKTFKKMRRTGGISSFALRRAPEFRGKIRVANLLARFAMVARGRWTKCVLEEGPSLRIDLNDRIERQMWAGCYEPHIQRILRKLLRPGDVFVDVGAHIGYHSALAAALVENGGCVIAFEADPRNFRRLRENLQPFPWASAVNKAVWMSSGKTIFEQSFQPGESGWGTLTEVRDLQRGDHVDVEAVSLDDWFADSILKVAAIKVDAEGSEVGILRGASRLLRESRPVIMIEANDVVLRQAHTSALELTEILRENRFDIFELDGNKFEQLEPGEFPTCDELLALPTEHASAHLERFDSAVQRPAAPVANDCSSKLSGVCDGTRQRSTASFSSSGRRDETITR